MISRFSHIILFLFITAKFFCQDILVKKDSSKIEVKLLEVRSTEIKYKLFDYQEGPDIIIRKNEVAYTIHLNGSKEIFKSTEPNAPDNLFTTLEGSFKRQDSLGNHIKFNVQLGAVMQSLASNYTRKESPASRTSSEGYTASSAKNVYNYNIGFNFLFGKSPYIKHVIGINYLRSTGEYDYHFSQGGYTSYHQNYHYVSKIDFINLVTGLRFKTIKGLYIEPLVAINIIAHANVRYTGTSTTDYIAGGPTPYVYHTDTETFSNEKVGAEHSNMTSTISLCPRISYEFNIKKQKLGVYASYNLAAGYRLSWTMAGITYYPFKKLK